MVLGQIFSRSLRTARAGFSLIGIAQPMLIYRARHQFCTFADQYLMENHTKIRTFEKSKQRNFIVKNRGTRNMLEVKEMIDCKGSTYRDVGTYRDVAEEYLCALNFKEAKRYCLKALDMHSKDPLELARDRRLLSVIESGNELDRNPPLEEFKCWGLKLRLKNYDDLKARTPNGDIRRATLGIAKFGEGPERLRNTLNSFRKEDEDVLHAMVFVSMAEHLRNDEQTFDESKRWLVMAANILLKSQRIRIVAEAYMDISTVYGAMNEFETAISCLKKSKRLIDKIQDPIVGKEYKPLELDARIGWLLLSAGKFEDAVACLEDVASRMIHRFGEDPFRLAYVYNNLGAAYMELGMKPFAVQALTRAQHVFNASYGLKDKRSIESCRNLAKAYATMQDYQKAIMFQEKAIEGLEAVYNEIYEQYVEDIANPKILFEEDYYGDEIKEEAEKVEEGKRQLEQLKREAQGDAPPSTQPNIKAICLEEWAI